MRDIELWKRIVLLGLFCKEIDKHIKNQDEVTNIINKYKIMINDREVLNSLENITLNNERKLNLVIQFIKNRTKYVLSNEDFIDLCNDLENTLGFSETASIDSIILNYEKLENEEYKKFLISNSYILENYLVNTIYREFVFFMKP
ncbi:hypothetical protein [Clostridium septicum]|uniref:hypothetical protein n=1 Tax=Clostridium septicum TaxID=1504 RepID=UPI000FF8DE33|nr:hypothetical protein [Clostridium septicum]QAS61611.1 hypothetical protein EI377_13175 [Clostridium septicum]